MADIDWPRARRTALDCVAGLDDLSNLCRAFLEALDALEREASGREHDSTAMILGPRMPDRPKRNSNERYW